MRCATLYYLVLDSDDQAHVMPSVKELSALLLRAPTEISMAWACLSDDMDRVVRGVLQRRLLFPEYVAEISGTSPLPLPWPLLVYCQEDSSLAEAAQQADDLAQHGAASGAVFAAAWAGGNYVVWHEALHLLGATDCYTPQDPGPTCEQANCIMQYAPDQASVGEWPFLCQANVERVRDRARLLSARNCG